MTSLPFPSIAVNKGTVACQHLSKWLKVAMTLQ